MAAGDVLGVGVSALVAFQRALSTTGHNIANVNTEGYSRQRVELVQRNPSFVGAGFVGNGVQVLTTERVFDQFLINQVRSSTTTSRRLETFHDFASQIDRLLGDPQAGLQPAIDDFFGSLQQLSDFPSAVPVRQAVLGSAEGLVARFETLSRQILSVKDGADLLLNSTVSQVNGIAGALAEINERIISFRGLGQGATPNDLLDQRDELLRQLSEKVAVTTLEQDDGSINVFIGNGQNLVVGNRANSLAVTRNPFDASLLEVAFVTGGTSVNITSGLSGGVLGGILQFRGQVLEPALNELGRLAIGVADTVNDQHQLGQDLLGNLGGLFFNDLATISPDALASNTNAVTTDVVVSVAVSDVSALTTSDYRLDFDGANYNIRRLSDNVTVATVAAAGFPQAIAIPGEGLSLNLTGTSISAGDSYLIRPTRAGAGDLALAIATPEAIAAAAPIRTAAALANSGAALISQGSVDAPAPPSPALQNTVSITFTGPNTFDVFDVTAGVPLAVGVAYSSGANISFNGWTAQISGTPATGDVFTVESNVGGVGDNRNSLLLAGLTAQKILQNGTASYQETYSQLVSTVGVNTNQAQIARTAQENVLEQAVAARNAVSGVNLDEEAANLVRFQQAYQAAAQVISITRSIFDSLLAAVSR